MTLEKRRHMTEEQREAWWREEDARRELKESGRREWRVHQALTRSDKLWAVVRRDPSMLLLALQHARMKLEMLAVAEEEIFGGQVHWQEELD